MADNNLKIGDAKSLNSFRKPTQEKPVKELAGKHTPKPETPPELVGPVQPDSSELKNIVSNTSAQTDISAEALTELSNLNVIAADISTKLTVLSNALKEKYEKVKVETPQVDKEESTSEVIADKFKDNSNETPKVEVTVPPKPSKPSNELLDNSDKEEKSERQKDAKDHMVLTALDGIKTTIFKGFEKSTSVADKISALLFKTSLTNAAKQAALLVGLAAIILAIDTIKILWSKWGADVMAKLDEWGTTLAGWWETFKEWAGTFADLKNAFDTMTASFMDIANAFVNGDWMGLAVALGKVFKDTLDLVSGTLIRILTKVISSALSYFGFKDKAKDVEAFGLDAYQQLTGNQLSAENQKKVAERKAKEESKSGKVASEQDAGLLGYIPTDWKNQLGLNNEFRQRAIEADKRDKSTRDKLSDNDKAEAIASTESARNSVERFRDIADSYDPNNKAQKDKFDKAKGEAQQAVNNIKNAPNMKAELQKQIVEASQMTSKYVAKPAPSKEKQDVKSASSIKQAEAAKNKKAQAQSQVNANVTNTVINSNKAVNVQRPITSSRAPGIFGATKVN